MGINVVWDDPEETTIRCDIRSSWTWDELQQAREQVYALMDKTGHRRVFAIANFVDGNARIPKEAMSQFKSLVLNSHDHPRAGLTVVVGATEFLQAFFKGLQQTARMLGRRVEFRYADSLEEARRLIGKEHLKHNQRAAEGQVHHQPING